MWKEQKYIHYLVKIIAILGILGFALIIIYIFSINNEIYSENNISFLYFLIIDISIILIPITLTFLNINKKFTKERNELKDLKASLINIRYESSYRLIEKLDSEEDKKKLLNNIVLRKFKEKFYINPIIINETVHKLRKFNIKPGSQISYADTFGFIIRNEEYRDLQGLDAIILKTYKLLNKYGVRKGYKRLNEGFGSFKDPILEEIDEYLKKKDYNYLRELLLTDLDYALIYNYHKKKPNPLTLYRKK